jgi:hypothetical protein
MAYGTVSGGTLTQVFVSGVVSSIAKAATGRFTVNRSAAPGATEWVPMSICGPGSAALVANFDPSTQTTTAGEARFVNLGNALTDPASFMVLVFDKV